MSHVSRRKVKKKVFEQMQSRFFEHVLSLKNSPQHRGLLGELLTPTEQIMLAKRFGVIFMLDEGFSIRAIAHTLKMSFSTIAHMTMRHKRGDYRHITKFLNGKKQREQFWEELELISRGGLSPMGKGRWNFLKKY